MAGDPAGRRRGRVGYLRALGRFYGVPECCAEAFVTRRELAALIGIAPDPPSDLHPERRHVLCPACAADPERADRLAAEAYARRIAPPEG